VLAVLYRPSGPNIKLFKTTESDIELVHDFLIPLPRLNSTGIRAVVL